ncbi:MAG: ATP-binding protein [Proteobacteria bacterium]|nr:ATP-binding protein [Pseudomonadota bacterium]MBU1612247.1 ATP-binding protein [Pseudomonadota bacterium]
MFTRLILEDSLKLHFCSELQSISRASSEIRDFLLLRGMRSIAFDVALICREAINNAVIHGNGIRPERAVHLELAIGPQQLTISVEDEGAGWEWRNWEFTLPDPSCESGRGLYIIHHYADYLSFNEKGNRLVIRKQLS